MVVVYLNEEADCPLCGKENAYVLRDNDKVCEECNYMPRAETTVESADPWDEWHEHRRDNDDYSGFTGENRIKFVGGFTSAYVFEDDF